MIQKNTTFQTNLCHCQNFRRTTAHFPMTHSTALKYQNVGVWQMIYLFVFCILYVFPGLIAVLSSDTMKNSAICALTSISFVFSQQVVSTSCVQTTLTIIPLPYKHKQTMIRSDASSIPPATTTNFSESKHCNAMNSLKSYSRGITMMSLNDFRITLI